MRKENRKIENTFIYRILFLNLRKTEKKAKGAGPKALHHTATRAAPCTFILISVKSLVLLILKAFLQ